MNYSTIDAENTKKISSNLYGENNHHIVESCFKGLARALKEAITIDQKRKNEIPSTKGTL